MDIQNLFYIIAIFFMLFVISALGFLTAFLFKFRRNIKKVRAEIEEKGIREAIGDKNLSLLIGAGILALVAKFLRLKRKKV
jgi:Na+/H+ antiporter NhaD/arsenite permease-like protein